jgi:hypothetical protein
MLLGVDVVGLGHGFMVPAIIFPLDLFEDDSKAPHFGIMWMVQRNFEKAAIF